MHLEVDKLHNDWLEITDFNLMGFLFTLETNSFSKVKNYSNL